MSNINQSSNQRLNRRPWAALWSVFLLAPLAMAPKGCNTVIVGDDCPDLAQCKAGAAGTAGSNPGRAGGLAGSNPGGGASAGNACHIAHDSACAADEFCAFDLSALCGSETNNGVCEPKPEVCDDISAPVCGCDGENYANECEAAAKGTSVHYNGACNAVPGGNAGAGGSTAGSGGSTAGSGGSTAGSGGSTAGSGGSGGDVPCHIAHDSACAADEFCALDPSAVCGAPDDNNGVCKLKPLVCEDISAPVCDCDGKHYANECEAAASGMTAHECTLVDDVCGGPHGSCNAGEFCDYRIIDQCGTLDQFVTGTCLVIPVSGCDSSLNPVCGCDGKTYDNACFARAAGVSVAATGACAGVTCGAQLGNNCGSGQYCNYPLSANCGLTDETGTCAPIPEGGCTANYDPVCGCDGKTYGNTCEATIAGMAIGATGACP